MLESPKHLPKGKLKTSFVSKWDECLNKRHIGLVESLIGFGKGRPPKKRWFRRGLESKFHRSLVSVLEAAIFFSTIESN